MDASIWWSLNTSTLAHRCRRGASTPSETVGDGAGVPIDLRLEGGDAAAEVLGGAMAVVVGDVLAQPAPEGLDRHEIGAVARQGPEFDPQRGGGLAHRPGAVIGRAVPEQDQ